MQRTPFPKSLAARPGPAQAAQPVSHDDASATPLRRWSSSELFGSGQEIEIVHGAVIYRLRLTALGKLILTK